MREVDKELFPLENTVGYCGFDVGRATVIWNVVNIYGMLMSDMCFVGKVGNIDNY